MEFLLPSSQKNIIHNWSNYRQQSKSHLSLAYTTFQQKIAQFEKEDWVNNGDFCRELTAHTRR